MLFFSIKLSTLRVNVANSVYWALHLCLSDFVAAKSTRLFEVFKGEGNKMSQVKELHKTQ